uniref:C3H1-type domain-containing protein n=1 Tax=Loa loa TaxID=7209 RepID=A0A1I7W4V3_LOALO
MLSTVGPQRAVAPLHTKEQVTSPVFNQKPIEPTVPAQLRQLLKRYYSLEKDADMHILPSNPNKRFVVYRGQLRTIDLSAWQTIQQDSIPPQFSSNGLKASPNSPLEDLGADGRVAPPVTPVTPLRTPSTIARHAYESERNKLSDKEREFLQKERRRSNAYKTSLCHAFRDTGQCSYGLLCRFAHGVGELLPAPGPHPKYKTRLCNKFALYHSCPYGSRCQFIHMPSSRVQNDLVGSIHMDFTASLDSAGKRALHCRHYSGGARLRNARVFNVAGFDGCDSFSQQCFGSGSNLQATEMSHNCNSEAVQTFCHQHSPNAGATSNASENFERILGVRSIDGSNEMNSDSTAIDNFFSTLSIGEPSNPFTQSCFPRINPESCAGEGATVGHANSVDMPSCVP